MVVANIDVPAILGFDVLHEYGCVLDTWETMLINGEIIRSGFHDQQAAIYRITIQMVTPTLA